MQTHDGFPPRENTDFARNTQEIDAHTNRVARLASQHHVSEYSCLKYGPTGYPGRYVPLSVQAPQTFQELRAKQTEWSSTKAWWHSDKAAGNTPTIVLGPSGSDSLSDGLAQELSEAMGEQLPEASADERSGRAGSQGHTIKTSSSHPINISAIIPPEVLAIISSHLMLTGTGASVESFNTSSELDSQPTVFEVPSPFTLDHFILHPQAPSLIHSIPAPPTETMPLSPHLRTRSHVTEALQAAINSGIKGSPAPSETGTPSVATFHAGDSSVSLSISLKTVPPQSPLSVVEPVDIPSEATAESGPPTNAELEAEAQLPSLETINTYSTSATATSFILGNMFMSSCPGKKVRLEGPVRGRSSVRRDLSIDLQRMKELRVGCVVCCLDDTELEFLGAPWPEYQAVTNRIGLDVLRLPTPEGLAPAPLLSPALLDKELTILIQKYTLKGIPVLVHCRGGVGRAGVISACWILKLGLCGWLGDNFSPVTSASKSFSNAADSGPSANGSTLRLDALELLEKVITVVRRRRSVKAVETYEQAQFLLDFIEYLRSLHN